MGLVLGVPGGRSIPVGANGLNLGYTADMLSILFAQDYTKTWCDGDVADCSVKLNFPGDGTTSVMRWDDVWAIGAQLPEKEWSGEWWRGNELGYIINNPIFWSESDVDPLTILLGATPSQHAAVRPTIEK